MNSTTLWSDAVSRTTADKVHNGVILTYEEYDDEAKLWIPVQRVAIPTDKYSNLAKFLGQ